MHGLMFGIWCAWIYQLAFHFKLIKLFLQFHPKVSAVGRVFFFLAHCRWPAGRRRSAAVY